MIVIVIVAELIVVTGPPGAGTTTVARALSTLFTRSALVGGDDFFGLLDQGNIANDVEIGRVRSCRG